MGGDMNRDSNHSREMKEAQARFLARFMTTAGDSAPLLRADLHDPEASDGMPFDPGLWFEWVQAYWEAQGVVFAGDLQEGENSVELAGTIRTLDVSWAVPPKWIGAPVESRIELSELDSLHATSIDAEGVQSLVEWVEKLRTPE